MAPQKPAAKKKPQNAEANDTSHRVSKHTLSKNTSAKTGEQVDTQSAPKIETENAHITKRNSEQSPFLRLPGELRNKIYEYVLGGNEYSVDLRKYVSGGNGCIVDLRNVKAAYMDRNSRKAPDLALLSVCRQIYRETATLPFSLNSFGDLPYLLSIWSTFLTPIQKNAITTLKLEYPDGLTFFTCEKSFFQGFPGLRLVVVYEAPFMGERVPAWVTQRLKKSAGKPDLLVQIQQSG